VPCVPANVWMRAVPVPAGTSQAEMTLHSTYLLPRALISLATLVAILWMLFGRRARPRRSLAGETFSGLAGMTLRRITTLFGFAHG